MFGSLMKINNQNNWSDNRLCYIYNYWNINFKIINFNGT